MGLKKKEPFYGSWRGHLYQTEPFKKEKKFLTIWWIMWWLNSVNWCRVVAIYSEAEAGEPRPLFAGDISCSETQNSLLRNVRLPLKILTPPPRMSEPWRNSSLTTAEEEGKKFAFHPPLLLTSRSGWQTRELAHFNFFFSIWIET